MANVNVYQMVTDRVLDQLAKGVLPWEKPWIGGIGGAISGVTGKPYSFINQLLLGEEGEYYSYNQIKKLGGNVKKGEKAHIVVFWKMFEPTKWTGAKQYDENGKEIKKLIPLLRYYNVFHINQCEGIESKHKKDILKMTDIESSEMAEGLIDAYKNREHIKIYNTDLSGKAFYKPSEDSITVPCKKQYKEQAEYYSTLFHECIHSTGHELRLNRLNKSGNNHFGSKDYSKEELVAEIGACVLNNKCGINTKHSDSNSVAYIAGWAKALENDNRLIVSASSQAEKAVNYFENGRIEKEIDGDEQE